MQCCGPVRIRVCLSNIRPMVVIYASQKLSGKVVLLLLKAGFYCPRLDILCVCLKGLFHKIGEACKQFYWIE